MVAAWACVEVPRYLFYAVNLFASGPHKIPMPLFWLRYTLFVVLYPAGISGELLQMWHAWPVCKHQHNSFAESKRCMLARWVCVVHPLVPPRVRMVGCSLSHASYDFGTWTIPNAQLKHGHEVKQAEVR